MATQSNHVKRCLKYHFKLKISIFVENPGVRFSLTLSGQGFEKLAQTGGGGANSTPY